MATEEMMKLVKSLEAKQDQVITFFHEFDMLVSIIKEQFNNQEKNQISITETPSKLTEIKLIDFGVGDGDEVDKMDSKAKESPLKKIDEDGQKDLKRKMTQNNVLSPAPKLRLPMKQHFKDDERCCDDLLKGPSKNSKSFVVDMKVGGKKINHFNYD